MSWTGKYKFGAIAWVRVGKYSLGTSAGKCKISIRVGKYKLGARAGRYKLRARAGKYKLGAKVGKYKLGARGSGWGPGLGLGTKQRVGDREIQRLVLN